MWLFATLKGRLALVALVAVAMFGGRWLFAHEDGEPCSDAFLCRALPARCVRSPSGAFCSRPCSSDEACPAGWRCGDIARERNGTVTAVERACLKPGAAGPFTVPDRR
jgi:hypothetical protein